MPTSDEFLTEFLVNCQKAMQQRIETEYKLLNMFIVLNSIIITAILGISELISDKKIFLFLTFSMAFFLIIITIQLTSKIKAGHKIYEQISQHVVKIWEYFELFDKGAYIDDDAILGEDARSFGKGEGYLKNVCLLQTMTIMTVIILIVAGIIKYFT